MTDYLGLDSFNRANQTGWGNASDGQTYHLDSGGGTYAIASNIGTLTNTTSKSVQRLGTTTAADVEATIATMVASSLNSRTSLMARESGATTYYQARLFAGNLEIHAVVASVDTLLASVAYTRVLGQWDFIDFAVKGSVLSANAWPVGQDEPSGWMVTVTDTSISAAGNFGVITTPATLSEVVSYDTYSVINLSPAPPPPPPPPGTLLGDNPYGWTTGSVKDTQLPTAQCISDIVASGAHWWRHQFDWAKIETSPGVYDWTVYDYVVGQANAVGLRLMVVIRMAPAWALTVNCSGTTYMMDPTLAAGFATVLATRYNGLHGHGIIQCVGWNEEFDNKRTGEVNPGPNAYWPCRDVVHACDVVKVVQPAIKSVHPTCLVGFPVSLGKHQTIVHMQQWTQGIYDNNVAHLLDFIPFHFYHAQYAPQLDDQSLDDYVPPDPYNIPFNIRWQTIASVCDANHDSGKQIWCTELGYQISALINRDPASNVTQTQQSDNLHYCIEQARLSGRVTHVFPFTIGSTQNDGMSLTQIDYTTSGHPTIYTPAYTMYQTEIATYPQWHGLPVAQFPGVGRRTGVFPAIARRES